MCKQYHWLWLAVTIAIFIAVVRLVSTSGDSFETALDTAWSQPTAVTVRQVGTAYDQRRYDCTPLSFCYMDDRSKTMYEGCFVPTAVGMIDPDQSVLIANGTDEAQPIKYGSQSPSLSIMPHSGSVARFGGYPAVGTYMYLFRNFFGTLESGGSPLTGRYKQIARDPDFVVPGSDSGPLNVNPNSFAYSSRSQWFVTEVPFRSLVRVNMADFSILPFDEPFTTVGTPFATHSAVMATTADGRYVAVISNEFHRFRVYDLKRCEAARSQPLASRNCAYHDYWQEFEKQVGRPVLRFSRADFVSDDRLKVNVSFDNRTTEAYLLKSDGALRSLIPMLGLGDSFASGEGAFNYLPGTDGVGRTCHVSAHSYQSVISREHFDGQGRTVACSGARAPDIGSQSPQYRGQNGEQRTAESRDTDGSATEILRSYQPGFLAQQRFVSATQPDSILLQIGGNDIGFGSILKRCLSPLSSVKPPKSNPNNCYPTYEDRYELLAAINRKYTTWLQLYRQLRQQSPASTLYVIGYPHMLSAKADCRLNVPLTATEVRFGRDITDYLNTVLRQAAKAAGVTFVDVGDALQGRELCSGANGALAVNGLTAGNDGFGLGRESFHPNALGHELIAQAIMRRTGNLSLVNQALSSTTTPPTVDTSAAPLAGVPRSGRAIATVTNVALGAGRVQPGQTINLAVDGQAVGLKPNTTYNVTIGGVAAGSVRSDGTGSVGSTVPIPTGTGGGVQVIVISGPGQSGEPVRIEDDTYVTPDPADDDGDGRPNGNDSCPLVADSGIDDDHDGIDDACDDDVRPVLPKPDTPVEPDIPVLRVSEIPITAQERLQPAIQVARVDGRLNVTPGRFSGAQPRLQVIAAKTVGLTNRPAVLGERTAQSSWKPIAPRQLAKPSALPVFHWYWWLLATLISLWLGSRRRR